jgi:hypothetical protein
VARVPKPRMEWVTSHVRSGAGFAVRERKALGGWGAGLSPSLVSILNMDDDEFDRLYRPDEEEEEEISVGA